MRAGPILDLPIHPYGMRLHLYNDRTRFRRAVNAVSTRQRQLATQYVTGTDGICSALGKQVYIGVFDAQVPTLVHELVHALDHIVSFCSLPHVGAGKGDEPAAYLMEYLFAECHAALGRHSRKKG